MNNLYKFAVTILMLLYIISPLDACPGPIDDILVIIIALALKKGGDKVSDKD